MAATIIQSFSNTDVKMRFAETYVSEGLNAKLAGVVPRGIYRGFALVPSLAPRTAQLNPDSLGRHLAIYESLLGFSLTLRRSGGTIAVPLAPFAGTTVYVVLFAEYTTSTPTVAELRVYSVADYNGAPEKNELIVLGVVDVPAANVVIPASAVNTAEATVPWKDSSSVAGRPWEQIVRNGSFDEAQGAGPFFSGLENSIPGFHVERVVGTPTFGALPGVGRNGTNALTMFFGNAAQIGRIGPGQFTSADKLSGGIVPVAAGQLVDVSFWLSGLNVTLYTAVTNGLRFVLNFYDTATETLQSTEVVYSDPTIHIGTFAYTQLTGLFVAPVSGFFTWYIEGSMNAGLPVAAEFRVDDVRIFLEPRDTAVEDGDNPVTVPNLRSLALDLLSSNAPGDSGQQGFEAARLTVKNVVNDIVVSLSRAGLTGNAEIPRWDTPFHWSKTDQSYDQSAVGISGTDSTADQDTIPHTYKLLHSYRLSQTTQVRARIYSKTAPALEKGLVITVNARWGGGGDQLWYPDNSLEKASKTLYGTNGVDMRGMFITGVPWSDAAWDTNPYMESLRLGGVLYLEKDVLTEGDYRYNIVREVTYVVPLSDFHQVTSLGSYTAAADPATEARFNTAAGSTIWLLALVIPPGAAIKEIQILVDEAFMAPISATLHGWDANYDVAVPPVPTVTLLASASSAGVGRQIVSLLPGAPAYASGDTQFECRIAAALSGSKIHGARVKLEVGGPSDI